MRDVSVPDARGRFEQLLADGALDSVFQPVVRLDDRRVVGYEALTRGPAGTPFAHPDALLAAARRLGLVADLDWACRAAAVRRALAPGGLGPGLALFLNVEPETLAHPVPPALEALWTRARRELSVVLELTERALTADPAGVLRAVANVRDRGLGVALDDVGTELDTLALLPLVRADVIKLDMRAVQERPVGELAALVSSVALERETTGVTVVAQGVESEAHVETALALGATLAQGRLFGDAAPLPEQSPATGPPLGRLARPEPYEASSPFELLGRDLPVQRTRKPLLLAMSKRLERQAVALGTGALVIGMFEEARFLGEGTKQRYLRLTDAGAFAAAFAQDLRQDEVPDGIRGGPLGDDAVHGEWGVVVVGHHFGAVLAAVPHDPPGTVPEGERGFDFVLTHDRVLAVESARILVRHVAPVSLGPAVRRDGSPPA